MKVLLDSSALAKRYIPEKGSDKVMEACRKADVLGVSVTCYPEVISALCRLKREKRINSAQYLSAKQVIAKDLGDFVICNITENTIARVVSLLEESALRAMDAFHIAAALDWKCDLFVSSDRGQVKAAGKAGIKACEIS